MKKGLIITALLAVSSLFISTLLINSPVKKVNAEEENTSTYTYTQSSGDHSIYRTYDDYTFAFSQEKHFKAPYGFELDLSISDEQASRIMDEIFSISPEVDSFQVIAFRTINSTPIYVDSSFSFTQLNKEELTNFLLNGNSYGSPGFASFEISQSENIKETVYIGCKLEIGFRALNSDTLYYFYFNSDPIQIDPYKDGDAIAIDVYQFQQYYYDSEKRVNLSIEEEPELFNEKYGYKLDIKEETEYYKEIEYIANDSVPLGNEETLEIENIPTTPLRIKARVKFKSGGVEYEYYTQEVAVQYLDAEFTLDGFNNRSTVGINQEHTYSLSALFDDTDYEATTGMLEILKDGESTSVESNPSIVSIDAKYLDEPQTSMPITFLQEGDYTILYTTNFENKYTHHMITFYFIDFEVHVQKEEPLYTSIDDALTLNCDEKINVTTNGDDFEITASIAQDLINSNSVVEYQWSTNRSGIVGIEENDNVCKIAPLSSGVVTLTLTCNTDTLGSITKSITINCIDNIETISTVNVNDGFHRSGNDIDAKLSINGYSNLLNTTITWKVLDSEGNIVPEEAYKINDDNSITLISPSQGDYQVIAIINDIELPPVIVSVRNMNMELFVQEALPFLGVLSLVLLAFIIVFKIIVSKSHSIDSRIKAAQEYLETIKIDDANLASELNKLKNKLSVALEIAESINADNMNQYDRTIKNLKLTTMLIKNTIKELPTLSQEEKEQKLINISQHVDKSLSIANEINTAYELNQEAHIKANKNNYMK